VISEVADKDEIALAVVLLSMDELTTVPTAVEGDFPES
jgi:hypothetical protein